MIAVAASRSPSFLLTLGCIGLLGSAPQHFMDVRSLSALQEEQHFAGWSGYVSEERIGASRTIVTRAIAEVLSLGPDAPSSQVEGAIRRAVESFNGLDRQGDGPWIMSIERDDICDVLWRVADLAGLEYDGEALLDDRDW